MEDRVYNFAAGPAVVPVPVLETIRDQMLSLPGVGASILEVSHRGKAFMAILEAAEANVRKLLAIPDEYAVLFLQGGSRLQFSMVPINLLGEGKSADYLLTGSWGKKALEEAQKEGKTRVAYTAKSHNFDRVPTAADLDLDPSAAYVHYTCNETIEGVQFKTEPQVGAVPLVCDASSDIFHRPLDIKKYGLIYACAQKNAGPAGVTLVILRKDLAQRSSEKLASYLSYQTHIEEGSMGNTPPTFAIYVLKLVTDWLLNDVGGLAKMQEMNQSKAALLYETLDAHSGFYQGHAHKDARSVMNVTFRLPSEELTKKFLEEGKQRKLTDLAGHRSVGGIRASIYNAMPRAGVEALRDFMVDFARANG